MENTYYLMAQLLLLSGAMAALIRIGWETFPRVLKCITVICLGALLVVSTVMCIAWEQGGMSSFVLYPWLIVTVMVPVLVAVSRNSKKNTATARPTERGSR